MTDQSILIIDDSIDNLDLSRMLLELEGYSVRTAEHAEEAMRVLSAFHPSLILMDIQLPGMDGLELTRRLRQRPEFEDVVIVALTAYAMKGDDRKAREAGCDGYITKPINTRTFSAQVEEYLNSKISRRSTGANKR